MPTQEEIENVKNLPTAFVIFGATGDLATKKIFPSLFELSKSSLLPDKFKIVAAARRELTSEEFNKNLFEKLNPKDKKAWESFAAQIAYFACDVAQNENLDNLVNVLAAFEDQTKACVKRVFYMAISNSIYEKAFENLGKSGLNLGCQIHGSKARIVIEKPFGWDFISARRLNSKLLKYFAEEDIYRIDHYLGKETVQNIFAFRFGNELFEPILNNNYIDHVQITAAEGIGIEKRGEYYDRAGALRDFLQNHLLQLMSLITMEPPQKFDAPSIQERKLEIIKSIKIPTAEEVLKTTVRGQYKGYKDEEKVKPDSQTETYSLVKLFIENQRWHGVPFYIRTGKRLEGKVTSIILELKEKGHVLFENFWERPMPNHITLQIQPNEGIGIRLVAKKPGLSTILEPVDMEFCYKTSFDTPQPDAYERLLLDIILGDQTLFISQQVVEQSWKIIDPIEEVWHSGNPPLEVYKAGTWGPKAADDLIKKDGRKWLAPILSICKL